MSDGRVGIRRSATAGRLGRTAAGVCALALLVSCSRSGTGTSAPGATPAVTVKTATATRTTIQPTLDVVGTITAIPERTAVVSAELGGWILKVDAVEGQKVEAGQTLVELDPRSAQADVQRAEAVAGGLRAEVSALRPLLERGEISKVQFEIKSRALDAADADLAKARLALAWCTISSPIDGMVVRLLARTGQYFDRAAPLATVMDLSEVFATFRIPSKEFGRINVGTKADVVLDSLPDRAFAGRVVRIAGEADPLTGQLGASAIITNDDSVLRPGLRVGVRLSPAPIRDALSIPVSAVADHDGVPVVTKIVDGKAYEVEIRPGLKTRNLVQVLDGLSPGDVVATAGGYGLPDGTPVNVEGSAAAGES